MMSTWGYQIWVNTDRNPDGVHRREDLMTAGPSGSFPARGTPIEIADHLYRLHSMRPGDVIEVRLQDSMMSRLTLACCPDGWVESCGIDRVGVAA